MRILRSIIGAGLLFGSLVGTVQAKDDIVSEFMGLATGKYDSREQMNEDIANDIPEGQRHFRVVRSFAQLDAPKVGQAVMLSTVEYHVSNRWIFDLNEFLVWTLTPSEDDKSFRMQPLAFKKREQRLPYATQPDKLSGFGPAALQPAAGGSNCVLVWTRSDNGFVARSEPCSVMSTTKGVMLNWDWKMQLTEDALWIEFNGRDETGASLDGTDGMTPYRLDRIE